MMNNNIILNFSAAHGTCRSRRWRYISTVSKALKRDRNYKFGIVMDQAIRAGLFMGQNDFLSWVAGGGTNFYNKRKRAIQRELCLKLYIDYLNKFPDTNRTLRMVCEYLEIRKEMRLLMQTLKALRFFFGDYLDTGKLILTDKGMDTLQMLLVSRTKKQFSRLIRRSWLRTDDYDVRGSNLYVILEEMAVRMQGLVKNLNKVIWIGKYQSKEDILKRFKTFPILNRAIFGFKELSPVQLKTFQFGTIFRSFQMCSSLLLKSRTSYSMGLPVKVGTTLVLEMGLDGNNVFNIMKFLEEDFIIRQRPWVLLPAVAAEIPDDVIGRPIHEDPANAKELLESMALDWGLADSKLFGYSKGSRNKK
jgi:hypothetical protein